jgi:DNA polymerase III delta prime subunit
LDLSFRKPTTNQAIPRIRGIARAEGLEIDPETLEKIIVQANFDLRQTMHVLQMHRNDHTPAGIKQR